VLTSPSSRILPSRIGLTVLMRKSPSPSVSTGRMPSVLPVSVSTAVSGTVADRLIGVAVQSPSGKYGFSPSV